ncbi:phage tail tape measure protein [Flavobacterium sp. GT2N3]|uniref:phage tail tape measure protein n=1 Tax=unclassified Flavobacterium TaxID=196869 RepID=UPI003AAF442E
MAKTISDEQMKLTMIINGNSAQKELFDLEKSTRSLNEQNKSLLLQKKLLEKQGQKDTDQYKLLTATMKQNTAEVLANKNRMSELQKEIGLTGLTMGQLQSKATMLRNTLRNLIPGSDDYVRYQAELTQVNSRLGELSGRSRTAQSSISSLADGFNRYQALALSFIATITGVVLSIQKIIDYNGKLSDAQADVMKTTRMTKEEVDELTKSFGLLKTRSQRIDLLSIAKVAGELNIAKSEVGAFVKVMDKAGVALGDSFEGGAEEVATKLGKIKNLYDELKDAKVELAFESVGSALNDLGADGNATAANISDFVTRVGTLSAGLKPSITEALGLGAAFEETGINAEIAGNNYGKLLRIAARDTPKFAQFMKMTNEEATKLINTDPTEFFLKFTEAFGKVKDATKQASLLDSLKLNDNEVGMIISSAAKNTDLFRQKIDLANESLNKGTSLTEEFNIKNSNLAATLEKIKKTTTGWFSSDTFVSWLTTAVTSLANLIGASDDADGSAQRLRDRFIFMIKIIAIVVTSYLSYNAAVKLTALWTNGLATATQILNAIQNRGAVMTGILRSAQLLLAASYYTITGNTVRATAAMRLFNASASANPLGLVLVAVMAVVAAMVLFSKETSKASKVSQMQADIQNEVVKSISKEKNEVEALVKVIHDETVSKDKKLAAIKRLNEIAPEYLKGLTLENIKTLEGKKLLDRYIDSLYKKARATAVVNKMEQLEQQKLDVQSKTAGDYREDSTFGFLGSSEMDSFTSRKDFEQYVRGKFKGVTKENFNRIVNKYMSDFGFDEKDKQIQDIEAQQNALKPEYEKNLVDSLVTKVETTTPDDTPENITGAGSGSGTKRNPNSSQAEIARKNLEEATKNNEELLNLDRQYQDDKLALMAEGAEKELLIEQQRYLREIADLEKKKVHTGELAKLNEDIAKAKESGDKAELNRLEGLRKGWDAKNQAFDDKINVIKENKLNLHNVRIGIIQEKGTKESLEKRKEAYDLAKTLRETKFNEELAKLGTNELAKEKLRKSFALSELAEEEKFLKELVDQFNLIVGKGNFGKMDMSLLTPEQVESFTQEAAKVGLTLSELIAKKNELTGKQAGADAAALRLGGKNTDIFGFTPENWVQFSDNLANGKLGINEMVFAVGALTDAYAKYNEFLSANENAQLKKYTTASDAKKNKLKKQLDSGMISQGHYNKSVEKIDSDLDNKKADLEYKQAKRQRLISAASIIQSTAQAIIGIWAQFPKADFGITAGIMSGVVGALGALQLATVLRTPLPAKGYESGLYPEYVKREQDGKMFKSSYQGKTRSGLVSNTSHFLVAENGPEMVIDNKAWTQMNPDVKEALVRDLRGIKGFEQGYYNQDMKRYEVPATSSAPSSSSSGNDQMMQMMMALVAENTSVLKDLRDKGVTGKFFKNDLQSAKNIQDSINDYNDLRNKSKK